MKDVNDKKKLLMHTCCAPCFTYIEYDLSNNGIVYNNENILVDYTAFSYNPNIHPRFEYERRKNTLIDFCTKKNVKFVLNDEYNLINFAENVVNLDKNKYNCRCQYCYYTRLDKTFLYAKENNYDMVSTTLSISPYQNQELIKKIGDELSKKYNITFWYKDYTKNFWQGQQMARELGLYRQKYCGCMFSIDDGKWEKV